MQIGMIGLGRMGSNMVRRLMRAGHSLVVFDRSSPQFTHSSKRVRPALLARRFRCPARARVPVVMVPVGAVDGLLDELVPLLDRRHRHRRRQPCFRMTFAVTRLAPAAPTTSTWGQRRRVGTRARLLPDDRR